MLVSIFGSFFEEKSSSGALIRMVGGLFLAFVMLSPIAQWNVNDIASLAQAYEAIGQDASKTGSDMAAEAMEAIISEKTAAYILDKASNLGAAVSVEVTLSHDAVPIPESVCLTGAVSPYVKQQLQCFIEEELGIPKERQIWTG